MPIESSQDDNHYFIKDHQFSAPRQQSGLYIVATPIGNLGDITIRALETLASCDIIACEDTRITGVLLQRYGIRSRMINYHEHNGEKQRPVILDAIKAGKAVALVSDAGTPLISDPGYKLVQAIQEEGLKVFPIPGASALLCGLVASGLPSDTVIFGGFLPHKSSGRKKRLNELKSLSGTIVLYESPHRLVASLKDMIEVFGPQHQAAVTRELTKRYEDISRCTLQELVGQYEGDRVRGEIVILLEPYTAQEDTTADSTMLLQEALKTLPISAAAKQVAKATGIDRKTLYAKALAMKETGEDG
ncbi:16S rRNA (cytidine(1402)-2'-O)-methyltransferase [Polycladidibacter stylochi]|uniref:16S rRNA (cytidine(1402)-2'-O)-methyltransferase n=1 Tax=Polycladidibacter stylochi TaxID=1807766 RepID=UPI0009E97862|nr:16S rRNA (cytidine(1402)-2'-O)-methyltransferase [Pseudovibrio stylochi]